MNALPPSLLLLGACQGPLDDPPVALDQVALWAYNIQDLDSDRQYEELVGTHFDMYVLEVVTTEQGNQGFDIGGLIHDIRQHNVDERGVNPLILAYTDIGEAEDWRWYFEDGWGPGEPAWIVATDPNDWDGNYPVAFWDPTWRDIAIDGYGGTSLVDATLDAGFDGIYMDWVEAFSDTRVVDAAVQQFGLEPDDGEDFVAQLMFDFIGDIGAHARESDPGYVVVAQNASDLYEWDPGRYADVVDGIALEAIWYDGDGGFDDWDDPDGYNLPTDELYAGWTEDVLADLEPMKAVMPIFCVEYAQDVGGASLGSKVYEDLAPEQGFIPYASRRSLARLSSTPYPSGYGDADY